MFVVSANDLLECPLRPSWQKRQQVSRQKILRKAQGRELIMLLFYKEYLQSYKTLKDARYSGI